MESLHIVFCRAMEQCFFSGISIKSSMHTSHFFYMEDAIFLGDWKESNCTNIVSILQPFFLASVLMMNVHKSWLLGVGVPFNEVEMVAKCIRCVALKFPFMHLGSMVGGSMSRLWPWLEVLQKVTLRLSK